MTESTNNGKSASPATSVRSVVAGIDWPGIVDNRGAHLLALLAQLDATQWLPPDQLRARQLEQLRTMLAHAAVTVPYYQSRIRNIQPQSTAWNDFESLPLLSRQDLQSGFEQLASRKWSADHGAATIGQSSGSTGTPVHFIGTAITQLFWEALTLREHLWQQRDFAGKLAAIRIKVEEGHHNDWGSPAATVFKTGSGATLNVRVDVERQLEWLQNEQPDYLITHASNLGALAELSITKGILLPSLRQARTYSEALRPNLREQVRAAWGVEVADVYSCEEAGVIALQCPEHKHYHVQSECLVLEVLRPDGSPCDAGEIGEVVLTTLHNFAMPLIRYRIGDYAEVGAPCPCGRGLPVLNRILGRQRNMLKFPDGRLQWPSFPAELWTEVVPMKQFQLVQSSINCIEIHYVMDHPLTAEEKEILGTRLNERLGFNFALEWFQQPSLPLDGGHKFEDFVSRILDSPSK